MFFSIISNKKLVMYHYCPLLSRGLESPRDKKQARSSNLVPQALNALFHSPHKMYLCTLLHCLAENQYPWHIMLRIILSPSNYNNVIACVHVNEHMCHSSLTETCIQTWSVSLMCRPIYSKVSSHTYANNVWTCSHVSQKRKKCHFIWGYLARSLMKCKLN